MSQIFIQILPFFVIQFVPIFFSPSFLRVKTGFAPNLPPTPHDLNGNKNKIDGRKHIRRMPIDFDKDFSF